MPELVNHTPFPNFRYYSSDNRGRDFGVIVVKATYEIAADGGLVVAEEQAPMLFDDTCHGAVNESSLWHPADPVPNKPRADLIVNAVARAPGGEPVPSWTCGLALADPAGAVILEKRLRVTGPRHWRPRWRRRLDDDERADWHSHRRHFLRWELSEPQAVREVALRYEHAYGGSVRKGPDADGRPVVDWDMRNPVGCGWIDPDWTDHTRDQPAPQIEAEGEPTVEPYTAYRPQSLGPIPPAWEPRLPLGGTYDQHWIDHVWPNWAEDYDFAYHNSAHPDLICPGHLQGGETIRLDNLMPGEPVSRLSLPDHGMVVRFVRADGTHEPRAMVLDTAFLDIAAARKADARVFLVWRINFEPDVFASAWLVTRTDHDALMRHQATRDQAGRGQAEEAPV